MKILPSPLLAHLVLCISLMPFSAFAQEEKQWYVTDFLDFSSSEVDQTFNAGFSMYVAAWPLHQKYPGGDFISGLPSTWMTPRSTGREPADFYTTIEGGMGWWGDTRFATETPKFIMGGVSLNFSEWANGPGAGDGSADEVAARDWQTPQGKVGVAQLSQNVLWPPDGLNLKRGTNGELFGYGYTPLPLMPIQSATNASGVDIGNHCWTLFLNTENFKGPISFFIPNFFSKPSATDTNLEGLFFDTRLAESNNPISMEMGPISALVRKSSTQGLYAKIRPIQFPATEVDSSTIVSNVRAYTQAAMWDKVNKWFAGGPTASSTFDKTESALRALNPEAGSSLAIVYNGIPEEQEHFIDFDALVEPVVNDQSEFQYRWVSSLVKRIGDNFQLPEYYHLVQQDDGEKRWVGIDESGVPLDTGLRAHKFVNERRRDSIAYVTPSEAPSIFKSPGPAAGPFRKKLGDGSIVEYYWYKFVDQPALRHWNFSESHRNAMQQRIELLHSNWKNNDEYLAPPTSGTLASLDPNLMVVPPPGLEMGYVPIVTKQSKTMDMSSNLYLLLDD